MADPLRHWESMTNGHKKYKTRESGVCIQLFGVAAAAIKWKEEIIRRGIIGHKLLKLGGDSKPLLERLLFLLACCFILQNTVEMSEESSSKDEQSEIFRNLGSTHLPVLKIEKLKREDDDEQWISGEELNTDGSSDEKGKTTSTKSRRRSKVHAKAKITAKGAIAKDTNVKHKTPKKKAHVLSADGSLGTIVNEDQIQLKGGTASNSGEGTSKCLEIIDADLEAISWRPKRGSIKLPTMGKEDTESEEKNLTSMNTGDEVFLNLMKKVNDLQASFTNAKEKTASLPRVTDLESESALNDKNEKLLSSEGLLQAYKQIERLDCLLAKNQESRRAEEALKNTIKPEEILPQVCSQKSKHFKHEGGVKGDVGHHGQLLPKGHEDIKITIPTKPPVNDGVKIPLNKGTQNENLQPSDILEENSKNLNNAEEKTQTFEFSAQEKKPSQHFIKRNIKLVTEGHRMGSLATITDEERIQLDHLLADLDQHEQALVNGVGDGVCEESAYSICFDTMGSIAEIDYKLEKINEERYSKGDQQYFDSASKLGNDEDTVVDDKRMWRGADAAMNLKRRLKEINKTLNNLNEPSKEIEPIEESHIQQLIDQFCGILTVKFSADSSTEETVCDSEGNYSADTLETDNHNSTSKEDEGKRNEGKLLLAENLLSSEQVKEIVALTKGQMPCFKYRHQEQSPEK